MSATLIKVTDSRKPFGRLICPEAGSHITVNCHKTSMGLFVGVKVNTVPATKAP